MRGLSRLLLVTSVLAGCRAPLTLVSEGRPASPADPFSTSAFFPLTDVGNTGAGGRSPRFQPHVSDLAVLPDGTVVVYTNAREGDTCGVFITGDGRIVRRMDNAASVGGETLAWDGALLQVHERGTPHQIARFGADGKRAAEPLLLGPDVSVEGVATLGDELFVGDAAGERVLVFARDATGPAPVRRSFPAPRVGEMVAREGVLWIVERRAEAAPGRLVAYDPGTGAPTGASLELFDPRDVAVDARGRLLVADGAGRKVAIIEPGPPPRLAASLGREGGAFAAPSGRWTFERFIEPNAVGADGTLGVFVADAGLGLSNALFALDAEGASRFTHHSYSFRFDGLAFDPESPADAYGKAVHLRFSLDGALTWSLPGFLRTPVFAMPERSLELDHALAVVVLAGRRYLVTLDHGKAALTFHRLPAREGPEETMRPVLQLRRGSVARWWSDGDGDGRVSDGEWSPGARDGGPEALDVDAAGGIWLGASDGIQYYPPARPDAGDVPVYPRTNPRVLACPAPFPCAGLRRLMHLPSVDRLCISGFAAGDGAVGNPEVGPGATVACYRAPLAASGMRLEQTFSLTRVVPGMDSNLGVLAVPGYLVVVRSQGFVIVRMDGEGAPMEVASFATSLYRPAPQAISAARWPNGEWLFASGDGSHVATVRWNPASPQEPRAAREGGAVRVTWRAPVEGTPPGYVVYRSTSSGRGYVRLTTLPLAGTSYLDPAPPAGAAFYRVGAAASAGGEALSYEAPVAP